MDTTTAKSVINPAHFTADISTVIREIENISWESHLNDLSIESAHDLIQQKLKEIKQFSKC